MITGIALKATAAALALSLAALGAQSWRLRGAHLELAEQARAHAEREQARSELARESYILADRAATRIDNAHETELARAARAAVADRAAADGVRKPAEAIAARVAADPGAACGPDDLRALGVLAGLVAESSGLVAEGAESVGRLGAQASALQAFVREVCVTDQRGSAADGK